MALKAKPSENKKARVYRRRANLANAGHLPNIGRPTRCTAEATEDICRALRIGMPMESAARLAGVTPAAVYGWIRRGKAAKGGGYTSFVKKIGRARAELEARNAAIVSQAAQGVDGASPEWKAAAWILERLRAKTWARTEKHEVSGRDGGPIRYEIIREGATDWRRALIVGDDAAEPTNGNGRH